MILCAACPEGSGSSDYEAWMFNPPMRSHEAVFERFEREGFMVGRHKAFQVSRDAARVHTMLVSELDDDFVRALLLHPQPDLQTAIDRALEMLPRVGAHWPDAGGECDDGGASSRLHGGLRPLVAAIVT